MQESYIARQTIFDASGDTLGYELLFRNAQQADKATFSTESEANTSLFSNMLSNFGPEWLLGGKKAFINVGNHTLFSDFIDLLDPDQTIFEITPDTELTPVLLTRIKSLHEDGFKFAFDDCSHHPEKLLLFPVISVIKIDIQRSGLIGLVSEINRAKKFCPHRSLTIIASKIETKEELDAAKQIGCSGFQGYYLEHPKTFKTKTLEPSSTALLQIIQLIRKEVSPVVLEDALKKDIATSLKLLRYINSAGFGLQIEITSFKHAIQILGYSKLSRWLMLLLATSNKNAPPALTKIAIARGRFMELIGHITLNDPTESDNLFLTGTFSFLDVLLGVDLPSIITSLGLSDNVNQALIQQDGPYFPYLMLAISTENAVPSMQEEWAQSLGITADQASKALLEATAWAESFTQSV